MLWEQEAAGSNPVAPTISKRSRTAIDINDPKFPRVIPVGFDPNELDENGSIFSDDEAQTLLSMIVAGTADKCLPEDKLQALMNKLAEMRREAAILELVLKRLAVPSLDENDTLLLRAATVADVEFSDKCLAALKASSAGNS